MRYFNIATSFRTPNLATLKHPNPGSACILPRFHMPAVQTHAKYSGPPRHVHLRFFFITKTPFLYNISYYIIPFFLLQTHAMTERRRDFYETRKMKKNRTYNVQKTDLNNQYLKQRSPKGCGHRGCSRTQVPVLASKKTNRKDCPQMCFRLCLNTTHPCRRSDQTNQPSRNNKKN